MILIEDPHGILSRSERAAAEAWAAVRDKTDRKKTSLNIAPNIHESLRTMARKHGRSMSSEFERLVILGQLVDEATEPAQDVISRMVEERKANERETVS